MSEFPRYFKGAYSSIVGLPIMRQLSATENAQLLVSITLKENDANQVADKIMLALTADAEQLERVADEMAEKIEKMRLFAVHGCGTKQKDVRGKQFSAIDDLANEALASYAKWKEK